MAAKQIIRAATIEVFNAHGQEQIGSSQPSPPKSETVRRDANYPFSYWNYERIQSLAIDSQEVEENRVKRIEWLKEDVFQLLKREGDMFQQLELVDALLQLGVAYHFEKELHDILACMQGVIAELISQRPDDLHAISQLFRVLRNFGMDVSQDVFDGFREANGGFKDNLCRDHKGMLSLYEASFLGMADEGTMDEAMEFTAKHLGGLLAQGGPDLDPHLKLRLAYALELPIHWRMTRLHARWFIDSYGEMACMNPRILELAKLDYNAVQNMYRMELKSLSKWWKDLSLVGEETISAMRCRMTESFFWGIGLVPDPKFKRCRVVQTKLACLLALWDDCYDVYGTLDELEVFTQAIHRWDASLIKKLPKCMRMIFQAMLNFIHDVGYEVLRDKNVDVIPLLKTSIVAVSDSYRLEAQWYHSGYHPSMEEYINNAWISFTGISTETFALCTSEDITEEAVGKYQMYNQAIQPSCTISRLLDDLATADAELARGDVPKAVQCYMFDNGGSEAMAREYIKHMVTQQWKMLNTHHPIQKSVGGDLDARGSILLGLPRTSHTIYQHGDGYGETNKQTNDRIQSLVVHPIPITT